jgi:hypothetical protein
METGKLTVSLSDNNAFEISPSSILESIAAFGKTSFTVSPKMGLSAGSYISTVTVSSSAADSHIRPVSFTVKLTVKPAVNLFKAAMNMRSPMMQMQQGLGISGTSAPLDLSGETHPLNITHVETNAGDEPDYKDTGTNEWTNILNKSAEKVAGSEDKFDITMSVTGGEIVPPPKPAVVVMIVDPSTSMTAAPGGTAPSAGNPSKMDALKTAANEFANKFLSANADNYLALASFASIGVAHKAFAGS